MIVVVRISKGERRKAELSHGLFVFTPSNGEEEYFPSKNLWVGMNDDEIFEAPEAATDWALVSATRAELIDLIEAGYGGMLRRSCSVEITEEVIPEPPEE